MSANARLMTFTARVILPKGKVEVTVSNNGQSRNGY